MTRRERPRHGGTGPKAGRRLYGRRGRRRACHCEGPEPGLTWKKVKFESTRPAAQSSRRRPWCRSIPTSRSSVRCHCQSHSVQEESYSRMNANAKSANQDANGHSTRKAQDTAKEEDVRHAAVRAGLRPWDGPAAGQFKQVTTLTEALLSQRQARRAAVSLCPRLAFPRSGRPEVRSQK